MEKGGEMSHLDQVVVLQTHCLGRQVGRDVCFRPSLKTAASCSGGQQKICTWNNKVRDLATFDIQGN